MPARRIFTLGFLSLTNRIILARFECVSSVGSPLRPSFAPRARTNTSVAKSSGIGKKFSRLNPSAEVSPLTPLLMTL